MLAGRPRNGNEGKGGQVAARLQQPVLVLHPDKACWRKIVLSHSGRPFSIARERCSGSTILYEV